MGTSPSRENDCSAEPRKTRGSPRVGASGNAEGTAAQVRHAAGESDSISDGFPQDPVCMISAACSEPGLEESRHYAIRLTCCVPHLRSLSLRIAGRLPTRGDPRVFRGSALQSFSRDGEVPMRNDLSAENS